LAFALGKLQSRSATEANAEGPITQSHSQILF
jgi:hypothetical protein